MCGHQQRQASSLQLLRFPPKQTPLYAKIDAIENDVYTIKTLFNNRCITDTV